MADFAPNYTHRYRMRYSVLGQVHTAQVRGGRGAYSPSFGLGGMAALLGELEGLLDPTFTVLGADAAAADSEVFLPTDYPTGVTGTSGAADDSYRPLYISFVGRSAAGARAVLYLYGTTVNPLAAGSSLENDYRLTSAESGTIAAAVAALNAEVAWTAIDAEPVTWYPYVNIGFNAYYQRKRRRG